MKTILKYAFVVLGVYFAVNWVADNPKQMDAVRDNMNQAIDKGISEADKFIKENTQ